jgi:EmrB/QacA subfamily drug resistance transporter
MSASEVHDERQRPGLTLAVLALSALGYILLQSMVLPALPEIGRDLHTSQSSAAWVLTAYLISASVATPVLGRLGDMFGKKRVLLAVLALLAVGSLIAALTSSFPVMLAARTVQGAGGAIFPLAFSIIRDEFPRERVAGAIGVLSALIGVGAGVAIVLAGPIVDNLSIHYLFWIPGAMTVIALVAAWFLVPESPIKAPGRISPVAVLTLSGWLIALLVGVSEGEEWGWGSVRVLGLFVLAVLSFAAWIAVETRAEQPLVDVRMMRIPAVWWTNISATLFGFGMYSIFLVIPAFLQTPSSAGYGFGASITKSGLALLPLSGAMLIAGIVTGRFASRFGSKVPLVLGSILSAVGMLIPALADGAEWEFYVTMGLVGLGIGFAFSAMSNLVVEAVPAGQTGVATGMNANVRTIGGAIGSTIVASIIASTISGSALPTEGGYKASFIVLAAGMGLAGVAAAFVPSRARRTAQQRLLDGDEFGELSTEPTIIAPAEAGLAIGERLP